MKTLFLVLSFIAPRAWAADTCASVWVYQPWKVCAAPGNPIDTSTRKEVPPAFETTTGIVLGGHTQDEECKKVANAHNKDDKDFAVRAEVLSSSEDNLRAGPFVGYRYKCIIQLYKYAYQAAPNRACGHEERWMSEAPSASATLNSGGDHLCLSCDTTKSAHARLDCLDKTVNQVIVPRAVELRADDLQKVLNATQDLVLYEKAFPNTFNFDEKLKLSRLQESVRSSMTELH